MRLPNLSRPVARWGQAVVLKTVTITKIDFVETQVITGVDINAVVQPAQKEKLNPAIIDWSREYLQIHSLTPLTFGQFIEYKGEDFKIVDGGGYSDYGYYEFVGEQTKKALLEITPP